MEKNLVSQRPSEIGNMQQLVIQAMAARKLPSEDIESIKQILRYVFGLIGLEPSKIPDESEKIIILDYMKNNMNYYSILDVKNAFTLYVQGKLDFHDKHFQKFSVLYLENVMQSYHRYRMILDVWKKKPSYSKEPTPEEIEIIHREATIMKFNHFFQTGEIMDYGGPSFNWLYKKGMLKLSDEKKIKIQELAIASLKGNAREKQVKGMLKSKLKTVLQNITENNDGVVERCKLIALKEFFQNIIDEGKHIKNII